MDDAPRPIVLVRTLGLLLLALPACDVAHGEPDQPAEGAMCVGYHAESRYRNFGYDHIVHLASACQEEASCSVTTDVAPEPIDVTLAPGDRKEVLTFRASPARHFVARVVCRLAGVSVEGRAGQPKRPVM